VHVDRLGDLHVLCGAVHDVDRHAGEVLEHDAAVVGRGEVGILRRDLVRPADRAEPEGLRRPSAAQPRAGRDAGDVMVLVDLDDRVGRRDRGVHRVVGVQRPHAVLDDALVDERAHRVVEQHLRVVAADRGDRELGRVVAGVAARQDAGELGEPRMVEETVSVLRTMSSRGALPPTHETARRSSPGWSEARRRAQAS
jgi:hypothetical protein